VTGTVSSGANNSAADLTKVVQFAKCMPRSGAKDFPDHAPDAPVIDTSRIPSAAGKDARSIPGFQPAADNCPAIYSGELGLRGR
jgi:hypothetical protein